MSEPETPDSFADKIAARYHDPAIGEPRPGGLRDTIEARYVETGHPADAALFAKARSGQGLAEMVETFYAELLSYCPPSLQRFCEAHVRVRGVRSYTIEGAVFSSGTGNYALIVTTALMTFLNKVKKFILAENDVSLVTHSDSIPVDQLTPQIVHAMIGEIIDNYRSGITDGPMILLDELGTNTVQMMLGFQEAFVVAHEMGHLLADHLLQGILKEGLHPSFGSPNHRSEYLADLIGYLIARQRPMGSPDRLIEDPEYRTAMEIARISSLCEFFEILELIYPGETDTHPAPVDRAANILATLYGEHFGAHYNARRAGKVLSFDWTTQFQIGVRPSPLGRILHALVTNDTQIARLLELVEAEGPDALAKRAAIGTWRLLDSNTL